MKKMRVLVAMSGGVDSSVAAYLLKQEGYEVLGATMKLIDNEESKKAIEDAKDVCDKLNIKHYVFDLEKEFKEIVIENFIESYKKGLTPNPCVVCNRFFKFGLFYEKAKKLDCSYIATGHYVKVEEGKLRRLVDNNKDQSYFLYGINKEILKHIIFPLSEYKSKDEIRKIAEDIGLIVAEKKDSQEVCFVPNDDYKTFLESKDVEKICGNIVHSNGEILGKHHGVYNYTIGQRKGLNISYKNPLYVIKLDTENNRIIVGNNEELFSDKLIATNINLLVDNIDGKVFAKVRSRGDTSEVKLLFLENNEIEVTFLTKQRAITPGQSVVFYDEENYCLGGGIIKDVK